MTPNKAEKKIKLLGIQGKVNENTITWEDVTCIFLNISQSEENKIRGQKCN